MSLDLIVLRPQRPTKNQRRGDVKTKNDHVNSETYHNLFVKGGVFDAAEEKMPLKERGKKTLEQQWI